MTIRLVIADDHSVVLQGLDALLTLEGDLEVCALCTDGFEAVEAVGEHRPDVLVMDSTMPRCTGLEAVGTLAEQGRRVPTVMLSATMPDATLLGCLRASVEGIVLKESAATVLVDAIRTVARGGRWLPPELTARAMELMGRQEDDADSALTAREKEVVILVAQGKPNKRVAAELGITLGTVKQHLHSAYAKLDVSNRVQVSHLARQRGWLGMPHGT